MECENLDYAINKCNSFYDGLNVPNRNYLPKLFLIRREREDSNFVPEIEVILIKVGMSESQEIRRINKLNELRYSPSIQYGSRSGEDK